MEATKKGKTVFVEYSSANKGQHFMTVIQKADHERIIIGRIFREYDSETKKSTYRATDFAGNQVFAGYKDLYAIKKQFIVHGQTLAQNVPVNVNHAKSQEKMIIIPKTKRINELKNIRGIKTTKEKTKEVPKPNPKAKINPDQKEKEQDIKNTEKYKDTEQSKDGNKSKENIPVQETAESNSEKEIHEEPEDIKTSEREAELDQIRDEDEDLEQEQEMDLDM
jgi:hypothetical protein